MNVSCQIENLNKKIMEITKETIVGDVVAEDYKMASVFEKYGIDFCCNGDKSIQDACAKKNIDAEALIKELGEPIQVSAGVERGYNTWPLDLLADYIEKTHHRYVETQIGEITPYLDKIVKVHGEHHPELAEVQSIFKEAAGEFAQHMKKEELMLFPQIRKMVKAKEKNESFKAAFGTLQTPIKGMLADHDHQGDAFEKISALTNHYTTPEDGCNTYRLTLGMLKEFEDDLHLHIHLENNILFPKAIVMEETFAATAQ